AAASFLSVRGRVARTLLELADYIGKDAGRGRILLDLRISGKDLAAMAGVARENVSRVLSDLRKRGVIEQRLQSYVLKNIGALEREVHHGAGAGKPECWAVEILAWPSRDNVSPFLLNANSAGRRKNAIN